MMRQRLRGESFKQEYQSAGRHRTGRKRDPSMNKTDPHLVIAPQAEVFQGKLVLVLDLDETLVYARCGPLYARPGITEFFQMCKEKGIEVVVWTAGLKAYAQAIVAHIDTCNAVSHCIYRHNKWFNGQPGYRKDLDALGRPLDRVLIVENTPDCIRGYQDNGILVSDYEGSENEDNTLYALAEVVRVLSESDFTVPQYMAKCALLRRELVMTDLGDYINAYTLDASNYDTSRLRINRDLQK
ncbi:NLI interacting factor-like phosphatase [Novymonas esmeraldas]|uniref:Mitochondrial import inner membrane translocase subunit TIM50 n=1 Tax=Novymonas esmeraldas TaxID=1808958 RepID=A0AAW0EYQ5_9TRYP